MSTSSISWIRNLLIRWNYPYYQVARFAAPNLMAGNTIILKHAPQDPESALAMEQIFHDAGLPEDAYINIFASNSQIADMIADPRVGRRIGDGQRAGATLRTGGKRLDRPGAFVEPTVLTDVTPQMRAYHEELFGPAAVIYRVADASEAVELANSSSFGLGGAVYSADPERAQEVADMLDTGMVWVNSPTGSMADLPFGGTKRSGVGRELGPSGIDEFVNKKLIYTPAPR